MTDACKFGIFPQTHRAKKIFKVSNKLTMSVDFFLVYLFIDFEQAFIYYITLEISSLCSYGGDMLAEYEAY